MTPRDLALALAAAHEQEASLTEQAAAAHAKALRLQADHLKWLASEQERQARPMMPADELLALLPGMTRRELLRLTRGKAWRVEHSRKDVFFAREPATAWALGHARARPKLQRAS